jgi:hypothetical protein
VSESGEKKPQPRENPKPKPKPCLILFHCDYCGKNGPKEEFCFWKRRDESFAMEMANKDRYRPSRGVPEPRVVPIPRGEGVVHTVPTRGGRVFPTHGVAPHRDGSRRDGFSCGEIA